MKQFRFRLVVLIALGLAFIWCLPSPLFEAPSSTLLLDREGELLSARIAGDEQWRFPLIDSVPHKVEQCILHFEDEYYAWHPGVNPISILRAAYQNIRSNKVLSGGSTISMQVIRLSRKNPSRTYWEKLYEIVLALRLEFSYSKDEILQLYATHAPYGGNVVGLETASWRYFNRPIHQLSWSESAMLAVLPNSPALIHLGKNRELLRAKRDRLLKKLYESQVIDSMTYSLSLMENIPAKPKPLPNKAYHLVDRGIQAGQRGQRIQSTLNGQLQIRANRALNRYVQFLAQNEVHNACAMIVSLKDQKTIAYVGNSSVADTRSRHVDLIQAPRSSGSILKPFLYAKAIEKGMIHTQSLLQDIPISINRFSPQNFDGQFEGVVPAGEALSRSLNVPATLLLRDYGVAPFHSELNQMGFSTITRSAANYGLTLILGGAEVKLWDLAKVYAHQAQQLNTNEAIPAISAFKQIEYQNQVGKLQIGSWWLVTEALTQGNRPGINMDWKRYTSTRKIAWKTGTSHGFRDAWAVGYDRNHLVAVWVGNADGEGRPGLTGASAAAPLMFELFQLLPQDNWFDTPEFHLKPQELCQESGYLAGRNCPITDDHIPFKSNFNTSCRFHEKVQVNEYGEQVFKECGGLNSHDTVVFNLSPVESYYYQRKHSDSYRPLQVAADCNKEIKNTLGIVYPTRNASIIVPKNFKGEHEPIKFRANHRDDEALLFWHLNDEYLGSTSYPHELRILVPEGKHRLLIMDTNGNQDVCTFKAYIDN